MGTLLQDIRYGARLLIRFPSVTIAALVALALGTGVNTALFSIVNTVLLAPLPFPDSQELVQVWRTELPRLQYGAVSYPRYIDWRARNHVFEESGAFAPIALTLTGRDAPERLPAGRVTASFFRTVGAPPLAGRYVLDDEDRPGGEAVVVIGEQFWRARLGGAGNVIGSALTIDGRPHTVIGIAPASYRDMWRADVWVPLAMAVDPLDRGRGFLQFVGRLRDGMSLDAARASLQELAAEMTQDHPEDRYGFQALTLHDVLTRGPRQALWILLGATAFVLLIACANVANLLLARATARRQELSVRMTLGAGRYRLLRQLLTESFVLGGLGALVGWGIASLIMQALPALAASGIPRLTEVSLDLTVLGFAAGLTVLTTLVFGLWPAWHASSSRGVGGHRFSGAENAGVISRTMTAGRAPLRVRGLLIVVEVSCALVLLVGAGLLILSLVRVQRVNPGFRPDHLLTMEVTLPSLRYDSSERIVRFVDDAVARVTALPDVSAVGVTTALPLAQSEWGKYFTIEGAPIPASLAQVPLVRYRQVTPDYLAALGATVRRGRGFSPEDRRGRPEVAIVNETTARRLWPDGDPIGRRVSFGPPEALITDQMLADVDGGIAAWRTLFPWVTIVGVVGDLRHNGLEQDANAEVFVPIAQGGGEEASTAFYLVARTAADPLRHADAIQAAIHSVDPNQPLADIRSMADRMAESLARRRFTLLLLAAFGVTAVTLALVGLYGVMAYAVTQRRKEMGIRAALGAEPHALFALVVGQGMRLALAGVAVGLLLAAALSQVMTSLLFEVSAIHPAMYAVTAALLLSSAALACWIPSRRAARVDPIATLRES